MLTGGIIIMTRIRKSPEMTGAFADIINDFIKYKRNHGYKYENEPKCLSRFCSFCEEHGITSIEISQELAETWIAFREGEANKTRSHRITCVRQLAIYLDSLGYDAYILPDQKGDSDYSFTPYIFTHDQIDMLMKAVDETKACESSKDMHLALPVIFRLLYGCGMRVSEVLGLRFRDVDLNIGLLTIRMAKNDKDRFIPLSDSVKLACIKYAKNIRWENDSEYFFMAPDRTMISPMTIYQRYRRYLKVAGIPHGGKRKGPRLHDLRHTFAVHVLQKWIIEEIDLTAMMPILSTYMGHKGIRSTALYLRLTAEVYPELMKRVESDCSYVIPEVA